VQETGLPYPGSEFSILWSPIARPVANVVYLFHASEPVIHLSLNQWTTVAREEFGAETRKVLADRAAFIRKRISDFAEILPATTIDLGSEARLPGDYAAGHALGMTYESHSRQGIRQGADLQHHRRRHVQTRY
jgi:MrcB-like, N-terminal domain